MTHNPYGFYTLFKKEVWRFIKVGVQTVLSPVLSVLLYLLIFAYVMEGRISVFIGVSYAEFLIPGLMMMSIIQNSFANTSSSLIQSKVSGNIIFLLLAPISPMEIFLAYTLASVVRGILVGAAIYLVAIFFIPLSVANPGWILVFGVLASATMGIVGILAGLWADRYEQMAAFGNFVIMPLSFLSGVFYSIQSLPEFWQGVSQLNPFFYLIDGFRYGFFGSADVSPYVSFVFVAVVLAALTVFTNYLLKRGYKIRN